MDTNSYFHEKKIFWIATGIGSLVIIFLAFLIGLYIGTHKTSFSYQWGENYHNMFGEPRGGSLQDTQNRQSVPVPQHHAMLKF